MKPKCPECHREMVMVKKGLNGHIIWACIDSQHCGYTQKDEIAEIIEKFNGVCRRNKKRRVSIEKACQEMLEINIDKRYIANELKLTVDVVERICKELKENVNSSKMNGFESVNNSYE